MSGARAGARRIRARSALGFALFVATSARAAGLHGALEGPPPFVPDLAPLRAEAPWPEEDGPLPAPLPAFSTAAAHAAALREDAQHGARFWVDPLVGDAGSRRVVFLVPQFHRNPLMPIGWTSLGEAIMEVQGNLDALTLRLVQVHGLRCIGSEGNWLLDMGFAAELRQAAQWHHDLQGARARASRTLGGDLSAVASDLETVAQLGERELRRHVALLDGVGVALTRLPEGVRVHRFGLEERDLNETALRLLGELRGVEEEIARLQPESQSEVADAVGRMWLAEIDAYEREVLEPLRRALTRIDATRVRLRSEGALDAAEALGRLAGITRQIDAAVMRQEEVARMTAYYRAVAAPAQAPGEGSDAGPEAGIAVADSPDAPDAPDSPGTGTSAAAKAAAKAPARHLAALAARRAKLQAEYERITFAAREEAAARRVLSRVGAAGSCALVMGAAHLEGVRGALVRLGGDTLGVVVVRPYDFGEPELANEMP